MGYLATPRAKTRVVEASGTGDGGDQRGGNSVRQERGVQCSTASGASAIAWKENEGRQGDDGRKEKKKGDMVRMRMICKARQ